MIENIKEYKSRIRTEAIDIHNIAKQYMQILTQSYYDQNQCEPNV